MSEVVIKETKGKAIGLSVLAIIMLLATVFILYKGITENIMFYMIYGFAGTTLFGYALVYILARTFRVLNGEDDAFLIKINDDGITDYSSKVGVGLIKWEDVKSVKVTRVLTQKYVSLELQDKEAFFSRLPKNIQRIQKLNKAMKVAHISLSVQTAKITPEELLEIIQSRLDRYQY